MCLQFSQAIGVVLKESWAYSTKITMDDQGRYTAFIGNRQIPFPPLPGFLDQAVSWLIHSNTDVSKDYSLLILDAPVGEVMLLYNKWTGLTLLEAIVTPTSLLPPSPPPSPVQNA